MRAAVGSRLANLSNKTGTNYFFSPPASAGGVFAGGVVPGSGVPVFVGGAGFGAGFDSQPVTTMADTNSIIAMTFFIAFVS